VLNELDAAGLDVLWEASARADVIVLVEPGDFAASRALSRFRDRWLAGNPDGAVLAPCPHGGPCGALLPGAEEQWCHHFARPPAAVFQDPMWARAARELGIDLRALPYAFLALARGVALPADDGRARVLGRPRVTRGLARLHACTAEGLRELELLERTDRGLFKALKKEALDTMTFRFTTEGRRIHDAEPAP
jgi:hypothetical protein